MKKITSKLVAVLMIVVMAFGISGTATVKTEAKESKGYVIKVSLQIGIQLILILRIHTRAISL